MSRGIKLVFLAAVLLPLIFFLGRWLGEKSGADGNKTASGKITSSQLLSQADGYDLLMSHDPQFQPSVDMTISTSVDTSVDGKTKRVLARPGQALLQASDRDQYHQILRDAPNHGAKVIRRLDQLMALHLQITDPTRFLDWVRENDLQASPNYYVTAPPAPSREAESLEAYAATGTGLAQWLGVEGRNGNGVKVAVLDSGISSHPAFPVDSIVRQPDQDSEFTNGHGTAVASLIAGQHPEAAGVAPGATLMDFPVLDADGIGDTFMLAESIINAADSGARIMNLSLGATGDSPLVRDAIAYAQSRNVIIVAAAGNEGAQQLSLPAYLPGVVAVGAVDAANQLLPFSNRGEGLDVVAPGYEVQAAWPNQKLVQMTGTSGAVPIVSGALAVLLANEPQLTAQQAVDILQRYSNEAGVAGDDSDYGFGVLNLSRMLNRNVPGIHDVAVVSQYLTGADQRSLNVVVENQGTETIYGIHVKTVVNGVPYNQFIQQLTPGAHEVRVQSVNSPAQGEYKITTQASGGYTDSHPENDALESVIVR